MVICCIEEIQVIQTVEPVSAALGLQNSQVMILASQRIGKRRIAETWALNYALFCAGEKESADVFELLGESGTISMMERDMEKLFDTFISIDGDGGVTFGSQSALMSSADSNPENEVNLILYYIPFVNLALIVICCCLFAYYRYRTKRSEKIAAALYACRDLQMYQVHERSETEHSDSLSLQDEVASPLCTTEIQGEI